MIYTVGRACRAGRSIKKLFVNINGTPLVCAILILASGGCQPTVSRWRTFKKKNRELTSNATNLSFWKSHGLEFISSGAPVENPLLHGQNHPFRLSPLGIAMDTSFRLGNLQISERLKNRFFAGVYGISQWVSLARSASEGLRV